MHCSAYFRQQKILGGEEFCTLKYSIRLCGALHRVSRPFHFVNLKRRDFEMSHGGHVMCFVTRGRHITPKPGSDLGPWNCSM